MDSMTTLNKMEHSTEEVPQIPANAMLDILSRLPVKILCRFRCVSKLWRNYLSDPYFFELHHHHQSQQKPYFVFMSLFCDFDHRVSPSDVDLEFNTTVHLSSANNEGQPMSEFTKQVKVDCLLKISLLPSHNNLICLSTKNHIYICNPSIQEFFELPAGSPFESFSGSVGFGYIPSTDEYKVVRLFYRRLDLDYSNNCVEGCEILTIRTSTSYVSGSCSSWKVLEEDCPYVTDNFMAFVNGSLYWRIDSMCDKKDEDDYILSFDLEAEKFWILPPPPCVKVHGWFWLVEIGEELWLSQNGDDPLILDMWMLRDWDVFVWVKEYSIDLRTMDAIGTLPSWYSGHPIDIRNEEILILSFGERLDYYNIKTKTFTHLGYVNHPFRHCYYRESFLSLRSI
ncbi:hypothetical protein L1049_012598 [Liquidambar formosana]|uniref:F-box domain-containing protein n=1 Tax=Liquidambar formosana TaxID=63359 RepID=A0AAP0R273_LIQFO